MIVLVLVGLDHRDRVAPFSARLGDGMETVELARGAAVVAGVIGIGGDVSALRLGGGFLEAVGEGQRRDVLAMRKT